MKKRYYSKRTAGLERIYGPGQRGKFRTLERKKKSFFKRFIWFLFICIIFAGGLSLASFYVFGPKTSIGKKVDLKIEGPEKLVSGDEIIYRIQIENKEPHALHDVELFIAYPDGFEYKYTEPKREDVVFPRKWQWDRIKSKETMDLTIVGRLVGDLGERKTLSLTADYRLEKYSFVLQKRAVFSTEILSPDIEVEIKGPKDLIAPAEAEYEISYQNVGDEAIDNFLIKVKWPNNFVIKEIKPEVENRRYQWPENKLVPNQKKKIMAKGEMKSSKAQVAEIEIEAGFLDDNEEFISRLHKTFSIKLIQSEINFEFRINNQTQNNIHAYLSIPVKLEVNLANTSNFELEDLDLSIELFSDKLQWQGLKLEPEIDSYSKEGPKSFPKLGEQKSFVRWSKDEVPLLDSFKPGDEIKFYLEIILNNPLRMEPVKRDLTNLFLEAQTKLRGRVKDQEGVFKQETEVRSVRFLAQPELKVSAQKQDGDRYLIGYELSSAPNVVRDLKITSFLSEGVYYAGPGAVSTGDLVFDEANGQVVWEINWLPPYVGEKYQSSAVRAEFLAAALADVDLILGSTNLRAKDGFTGSEISLIEDPLRRP